MFFSGFFDDYDRSIKNTIVEEKYDLVFSRPLGFIFAKFLSKLRLSPTNISVLGMIIGVSGGTLLYWQNSLVYVSIGGILITIAGIMDSADGQAARLYDKRSEMGKYLDMFNDMLVFISCYVAGVLFFGDQYTVVGIWAIGLISGYVHSLKANIYEYTKGELLHFSLTDSTHRNDSVEYIRENFDRTGIVRACTYPILIDYVKRQNKLKFRSDEVTEVFEKARKHAPEAFKEIYIKYNRKVLTVFAWICGSNITRNSIILTSLFGRLDIYLLANIASYLLFLVAGLYQKKIDKKVLREISSWDLS